MRYSSSGESVAHNFRRVAPALIITGLLAITGCAAEEPAIANQNVPTTSLEDRFSAMPEPCVIEESPTLDATARALVEFWHSEGIDTQIEVVYVPKIDGDECQVKTDGVVNTIRGAQDLSGYGDSGVNSGVAISPPKRPTSDDELRLILRHEAGHQVQEVQGVDFSGNTRGEATADCYAGMSSQDVPDTEVNAYRAALRNAGSNNPNDPHGTGAQREAYFMNGYTLGSCEPEAIEHIRRNVWLSHR